MKKASNILALATAIVATASLFSRGSTPGWSALPERPNVSVAFDGTTCAGNTPLLATVENTTGRRLGSVVFDLSGRDEMMPQPVFLSRHGTYGSDRLLWPNETAQFCVALPQKHTAGSWRVTFTDFDLSQIEWRVIAVRPDFVGGG